MTLLDVIKAKSVVFAIYFNNNTNFPHKKSIYYNYFYYFKNYYTNPTFDKKEERSLTSNKRKFDKEKHLYPSLEIFEFKENEVSHKLNLHILRQKWKSQGLLLVILCL